MIDGGRWFAARPMAKTSLLWMQPIKRRARRGRPGSKSIARYSSFKKRTTEDTESTEKETMKNNHGHLSVFLCALCVLCGWSLSAFEILSERLRVQRFARREPGQFIPRQLAAGFEDPLLHKLAHAGI